MWALGAGEGSNPAIAGEGKKGFRVKTHYVLIDYENVQPKNLAILNGHSVTVIVFVGATQKKVPADYPASLRAQGIDAEKIKIAGSGPNALDFHIAFYIGQYSAHSTNTHFHIISKDKGFDPLIRHLKGKNINVSRRGELAKIPLPKKAKTVKPAKPPKSPKPSTSSKPSKPSKPEKTDSLKEMIDKIVRKFGAPNEPLPRNVKRLAPWINNLFQNNLSKAQLQSLIDELCRRKIVAIHDNKITYGPPIGSS